MLSDDKRFSKCDWCTHFKTRKQYLDRLMSALTPNGRILIVSGRHRVSAEEAAQEQSDDANSVTVKFVFFSVTDLVIKDGVVCDERCKANDVFRNVMHNAHVQVLVDGYDTHPIQVLRAWAKDQHGVPYPVDLDKDISTALNRSGSSKQIIMMPLTLETDIHEAFVRHPVFKGDGPTIGFHRDMAAEIFCDVITEDSDIYDSD